MLVLTRRLDQSLMIGEPKDPEADENAVEVIVVEIRADAVRLGFRAPRHVTVHRSEIYQQIWAEIQVASDVAESAVGADRAAASPGTGNGSELE